MCLMTIAGCLGAKAAFVKASQKDTVEAYEDYLKNYPDSVFSNSVAWNMAMKKDTIEAYEDYLRRVPGHRFCAWKIAMKKDTIEAYEDYLKNYPDSSYSLDAAWKIVEKKGSIGAYKDFIEKYPGSIYAKEASARIQSLQKGSKPEVIASSEAPKKQLPYDSTPPEIIISSHDISRGINIVRKQKKVTISGRAIDKSGIVEVIVDNKEANVDRYGNFYADIYVGIGENQIVVSAMDRYENRATKKFTIIREGPEASPKDKIAGNYYALIIGNNNYKYIRKLETAKKDAQDVMDVLKQRYGFKTKLLLDAKRNDIVSAINDYRKTLKENDNFLIYYAGHGEFDRAAGKAYWLPVDARSDDDTNWIIVDTITSNIKRISSKHILIVADSCYSGTFTRRAITDLVSDQERDRYLQKMQTKASRTLLASGGNEPVSDIGGKEHSVFADALILALKDMGKKAFSAEELFYQHIKERVAGKADQTPEYNVIRNSGHEGGDFVFKRIY